MLLSKWHLQGNWTARTIQEAYQAWKFIKDAPKAWNVSKDSSFSLIMPFSVRLIYDGFMQKQ